MVETRLNQDLRAASDLVARDLRRAGFWDGALNGTVAPSGGGPAAANPYRAVSWTAGNPIVYGFSRDATENNTLDANEQFGFRLINSVLEMQTSQGTWRALTDPRLVSITNFGISEANTVILVGARMTDAGLNCHCPGAAGTANLGSTSTPSFTVAFQTLPNPLDPATPDPRSVRVTAWGCSAHNVACSAGTAPNADANAVVTAILKLKPVLPAMPASALTCGTSCTVGGSANINNSNVPSNGVLVNAGTSITTAPGVSLSTIPGQPASNALIGNDASLSALSSADPTCSNSAMFKTYFGTTMEKYKENARVLSCGSASDCKSKLLAAYGEGDRAFYFDSDLHLSGNDTLGIQDDAVSIVTPHAIDINGNWNIYGLIFSNSATWNDLGTGTAVIHGAQISCAAYKNNGNGTISYDAKALTNLQDSLARLVRVPGSWKDF